MPGYVYVGNLPSHADWKFLKDLFRDQGIPVRKADVLEDSKGQSRGYGIVEVRGEEDIKLAIERLDRMEVEGRSLNVREDRVPEFRPDGKGKGKGKEHSETHPQGNRESPKPGDWYCLSCGDLQFARNQECRVCSAPRPKEDHFAEEDWRSNKDHVRNSTNGHSRSWPAGGKESSYAPRPDSWREDRSVWKSRSEAPQESEKLPPWKLDRTASSGSTKRPVEDERRAEQNVCRHWAKGYCKLGADCKYMHPNDAKGTNARREDNEEAAQRRLLCENLAPTVTWKSLKDFFRNLVVPQFTDIVESDDGATYGVVEFSSRTDALEACMQLNGELLEGEPIRLRQDRGEFNELRAAKRQRVDASAEPIEEEVYSEACEVMEVSCPACGHVQDEGKPECDECGAKFDEVDPAPEVDFEADPEVDFEAEPNFEAEPDRLEDECENGHFMGPNHNFCMTCGSRRKESGHGQISTESHWRKKEPVVCRYWKTKGWCRNESSCKFSHPKGMSARR